MKTEETFINIIDNILGTKTIIELRDSTIGEKRGLVNIIEKHKGCDVSLLTDDEVEIKFNNIVERYIETIKILEDNSTNYNETNISDGLNLIISKIFDKQVEPGGLIKDEFKLEEFKANIGCEVMRGGLSEKELNEIIKQLGDIVETKENIKITKLPIFNINGKAYMVDIFTGSLEEIERFIFNSEDEIVLHSITKNEDSSLFDLEYWRNE
jgi:hypothetical protein